MMFMKNNICFEKLVEYCDRDDLLSLTYMKNSAPISLTRPHIRMIFNIIGYFNFMLWNGDRAFVDNPTQWNMKDFEDLKLKEQPFSYDNWRQIEQASNFVSHSASLSGAATTTVISAKIVLTEKVILDNPSGEKIESITTTTTTPGIHTDFTNNNSNLNIDNSKEERKEPKEVSSNLNSVATATVVDHDDINNTKSPTGCKNSIGDLDGI